MPVTRFFLYRGRDVMLISLGFIVYMHIISTSVPQGEQIAYIAWNPFQTRSQIHLLDVDRGLRTVLFERFGRIDKLAWSPEGDTLYFGTFREERIGRDLASLDVDTGVFRWLTDFPLDNNTPAVSPDGRTLAFQHFTQATDNWDIHLLDLETGAIRVLVETARRDGLPYWTNDGAQVLFEQFDSFGVCIITVTVATGVAETGACGEPDMLARSPDGTLTAFSLYRNQSVDVYIGDANADNWRQMTAMGGFAYSPDWSPDGRDLVFVFGQIPGEPDALYTVSLLDETPRQIAPADVIHIAPIWRPSR